MLARSLLIWCLLLALAVVNGAIREAWIVPRVGTVAGHALSTSTLCAFILWLSWMTIDWLRPLSTHDAWTIGGMWVGLTVAFEFLAGHYWFGHPWSRLLEDYNFLRGRIWVLVLVTTAVAPWVAARARGIVFAGGPTD